MKYSARPVNFTHKGHTYQWHLNFDTVLDFHPCRQWLNETYDWGYPVNGGLTVNDKCNDKWCWETQYMIYDIYLATDAELSWFKLKWGSYE